MLPGNGSGVDDGRARMETAPRIRYRFLVLFHAAINISNQTVGIIAFRLDVYNCVPGNDCSPIFLHF